MTAFIKYFKKQPLFSGRLEDTSKVGSTSSINKVGSTYSIKGFTLIELLVVLVILALFSSMVVLSIGDSFQRKLLAEAERLQSIMIAASDQAIYSSSELGFYFSDNEYRVLRWDNFSRSWVQPPLQQFLPYTLPEGMKVRLIVDGFLVPGIEDGEVLDIDFRNDDENSDISVNLGEDNDLEEEGKATDLTPQVLLLSSAEISVFDATLYADESVGNSVSYKVHSDGFSLPRVRSVDFEED